MKSIPLNKCNGRNPSRITMEGKYCVFCFVKDFFRSNTFIRNKPIKDKVEYEIFHFEILKWGSSYEFNTREKFFELTDCIRISSLIRINISKFVIFFLIIIDGHIWIWEYKGRCRYSILITWILICSSSYDIFLLISCLIFWFLSFSLLQTLLMFTEL